MDLIIAGYYKLTRKLGNGSFGTIYEGKLLLSSLGKSLTTSEVVAVKLVTLLGTSRSQ